MLANFDDIETGKQNIIPQSIISDMLPKNLSCEKEKNSYIIKPISNMPGHIELNIDVERISKEILKQCKKLKNPYEILMFLSLKCKNGIPVKNVKMGDGKKNIHFAKIGKDLFCDISKINNTYIDIKYYPIKFLIDDGNGHNINIVIEKKINREKQVISYDTMINSPLGVHFEIDFLNKNGFNVNYSISINKCKTTKEVVDLLYVVKAILNHKVRINGKKIENKYSNNVNNNDQTDLDNVITFWNKIVILEQKAKIKFSPLKEMSVNDNILLQNLIASIIDGKELKFNRPFNSFNVNDKNANNNFEKIINIEGVMLRYFSGPVIKSIMGAKILLYSINELRDFIVYKTEELNKNDLKVYIKDSPGKTYYLAKKYLLKAGFDKMHKKEV